MPGLDEKTVFLSYRHTKKAWARAIEQNLTHNEFDVFLDDDDLHGGEFEPAIMENVRSRAHFLVVLTPSALDRLASPQDWLRREIEEALKAHRNIVPVLMDGFDFSAPTVREHLTGALSRLPRFQALVIHEDYFPEAMDRLRDRFLHEPTPPTTNPMSPEAHKLAHQRQDSAARAGRVSHREIEAQAWFERAAGRTDVPEEVVRLLTEAIRRKPSFAEAYANRGLVRARLGDSQGALQDADRAVELEPSLADVYRVRGSIKLQLGDIESAVVDFTAAISLDAACGQAFLGRAMARKREENFDGAIEDLRRVLEIEPNLPEAFYKLGGILLLKGDVLGAILTFDQAIQRWPEKVDGYHGRALAKRGAQDLVGEVADWTEVLRLDPARTDTYEQRAKLRLAMGDLAGAMADCDEAIRLKPDSAGAYCTRGIVRNSMGASDDALKDITKAIRLDPAKAEPWWRRASLLFARGRHDESLADANEAVRLDPRSADAHGRRANAREATGDLEGAIRDWRTFLELGGGESHGNTAEIEAEIERLEEQLTSS